VIVEAASIDSPVLQAFPFHLNILICRSRVQKVFMRSKLSLCQGGINFSKI
jgi:hypothetical protein